MLEKFSTLPVALPWASCAWKASLRVGAGGLGRLRTASPVCSPSTSLEVSLVLNFFFLRSPRGILPGPTCAASGLLPPWLAPRTLCPAARPLEAGAAWAGPIAEALRPGPVGSGPPPPLGGAAPAGGAATSLLEASARREAGPQDRECCLPFQFYEDQAISLGC